MGMQFAKLCGANVCDIEKFSTDCFTKFDLTMYSKFLEEHIYIKDKYSFRNSNLVCEAIESIFCKVFKD